jgi:hypothetical protein
VTHLPTVTTTPADAALAALVYHLTDLFDAEYYNAEDAEFEAIAFVNEPPHTKTTRPERDYLEATTATEARELIAEALKGLERNLGIVA